MALLSSVGLHQSGCLAPLASLDCSITEPISEPHARTTDTPTLSSYFECDQLSDMVDGSLFEITATGCLSKSVFPTQSRLDGQLDFNTKSSTRTPEGSNSSGSSNSSNSSNSGSSGSCSKMISRQDKISSILKSKQLEPNSAEKTRPKADRTSQLSQANKRGQATISAALQSHDYSSTMRVPALARQNGNQRVRVRTSRFVNDSLGLTNPDEPALSQTQIEHRNCGRKTRSIPDFRHEDATSSGSSHLATQSLLTGEEGSGRRKEKRRRFSLGIFNLFASDANTKQSYSNRVNLEGSRQHQSTGEDRSAPIRSQTHRRAHTNASSNLRLSNSSQDFQRPHSSSVKLELCHQEVLLNLSKCSNAYRLGSQLRASQSSYSVSKPTMNQQKQSVIRQQQPRPVKTVKFKMPDKAQVMETSGTHGLPAADSQPMAPIIKKPVAQTLSRYSQTESNAKLEEMFAKYERNNELIQEISEKLRLTDTIASPISVLDDENYDFNNNSLGMHDNQDGKNGDHDDGSDKKLTIDRHQTSSVDKVNDPCIVSSCDITTTINIDQNNIHEPN